MGKLFTVIKFEHTKIIGKDWTIFISKYNLETRYSQTRLIRTLLIRHFHLIRRGNLKTLKPLPLTPMLNQPFN